MGKSYKVALAVDAVDYWIIAEDVDKIDGITAIDLRKSVVTPDNTYLCAYWDDIYWDMEAVRPLLRKLESFRHALITISEEGEIWKDIEDSDSRGTDEEFYEVLSWNADICFWEDGAVLAPERSYVPISRERLIQLLQSYVANDADGMCETSQLFDALVSAGFSDREIDSLGFGYCIPD